MWNFFAHLTLPVVHISKKGTSYSHYLIDYLRFFTSECIFRSDKGKRLHHLHTASGFRLFGVKKAPRYHLTKHAVAHFQPGKQVAGLCRTSSTCRFVALSLPQSSSPAYSWRRRWLGWWPCSSWPGPTGWCWPPGWPGRMGRRWPAGPWCRTAASTADSRRPWSPPWRARAAPASCSSTRWCRWPGEDEDTKGKEWK